MLHRIILALIGLLDVVNGSKWLFDGKRLPTLGLGLAPSDLPHIKVINLGLAPSDLLQIKSRVSFLRTMASSHRPSVSTLRPRVGFLRARVGTLRPRDSSLNPRVRPSDLRPIKLVACG